VCSVSYYLPSDLVLTTQKGFRRENGYSSEWMERQQVAIACDNAVGIAIDGQPSFLLCYYICGPPKHPAKPHRICSCDLSAHWHVMPGGISPRIVCWNVVRSQFSKLGVCKLE
jgi:hypothetical protein